MLSRINAVCLRVYPMVYLSDASSSGHRPKRNEKAEEAALNRLQREWESKQQPNGFDSQSDALAIADNSMGQPQSTAQLLVRLRELVPSRAGDRPMTIGSAECLLTIWRPDEETKRALSEGHALSFCALAVGGMAFRSIHSIFPPADPSLPQLLGVSNARGSAFPSLNRALFPIGGAAAADSGVSREDATYALDRSLRYQLSRFHQPFSALPQMKRGTEFDAIGIFLGVNSNSAASDSGSVSRHFFFASSGSEILAVRIDETDEQRHFGPTAQPTAFGDSGQLWRFCNVLYDHFDAKNHIHNAIACPLSTFQVFAPLATPTAHIATPASAVSLPSRLKRGKSALLSASSASDSKSATATGMKYRDRLDEAKHHIESWLTASVLVPGSLSPATAYLRVMHSHIHRILSASAPAATTDFAANVQLKPAIDSDGVTDLLQSIVHNPSPLTTPKSWEDGSSDPHTAVFGSSPAERVPTTPSAKDVKTAATASSIARASILKTPATGGLVRSSAVAGVLSVDPLSSRTVFDRWVDESLQFSLFANAKKIGLAELYPVRWKSALFRRLLMAAGSSRLLQWWREFIASGEVLRGSTTDAKSSLSPESIVGDWCCQLRQEAMSELMIRCRLSPDSLNDSQVANLMYAGLSLLARCMRSDSPRCDVM